MIDKEQYCRIQEAVVHEMDDRSDADDEEILECIERKVLEMGHTTYLSVQQKREMVRSIFYSIRKLDVLQEILEDGEITEIMVNGPDKIFVERAGKIEPYPKGFFSAEKLDDVIQQIVSKVNRRVNEANPIVDVRLLDGSRVNIVLPPVAINGPIVTVRKFPDKPISMDKLIEISSVSREVAELLQTLVQAKYNIFISGGTGSGKTTFLNALSQYIPADERIITIEDSAELKLQSQPNLVRLEVRNANVEGKNEVTIRDLMKSALRMRPDRIILGEVRDAAACELLSVMNTGHDGSLCTGHANSPSDMMNRLETLVLTGMDIPLPAIRNQIASALDIVVQLGRLRDKSRRVLEVDEVLGVQDGQVKLSPLYTFCERGEKGGRVQGELISTGNKLQGLGKLERAGIHWKGENLCEEI